MAAEEAKPEAEAQAGQLGYETGVFDTRDNGGKWDWQIAPPRRPGGSIWDAFASTVTAADDNQASNLADDSVVASFGRSF